MKKIFIIILFLLSELIFPQSLNEKLNKYLETYYLNKEVPSINAGLSVQDSIIWLGSKGYADIENNVIANPKSVYRIASISKFITAVAIMQLVEKNKINLDVDIRTYVPYYPKKKWMITPRQILNHTSGFRDYRPGEFDSKINFEDIRNVINYLSSDSLEYEPGTKFQYTTLSFNLLAAAIEYVTQMNFYDYLKKYIFEPAGMKNTYLDFYNVIIPHRAKGYVKNDYRELNNASLADLTIKFPGGGVLSTTEDLLKFGNALINGKLINKNYIDTMLVPTKLKNGKIINYGLGTDLNIYPNKHLNFGHAGAGTGFVSQLIIFPKEKVVSVHLINLRDDYLENPAKDIAAIYFNESYKLPQKSLADRLLKITISTNIDSAMALYTIIKNDSSNFYVISDVELDRLGKYFLKLKMINEAIVTFNQFITEYPKIEKGYVGLGDAYYNDHNKGLAIKSYRKALSINPRNQYVLNMIKKIELSK